MVMVQSLAGAKTVVRSSTWERVTLEVTMKKVENITSVVGTIIERVLQELPNVTTEETNVADLGNWNDGDSLPEVVRMGSEHWSPVNGINDRAREGWDETLRYGVKRAVEVIRGAFDHLGHIHDDEHQEMLNSNIATLSFALADDYWDFDECPNDFRVTWLREHVEELSERLWAKSHSHWRGNDDAIAIVNRLEYRKMKRELREWEHLDESYDGADNVAWEIEHLREEAKRLREELAQEKSSTESLCVYVNQLKNGNRPRQPEQEGLTDSEYDCLVQSYREELKAWHIDQISKALSAMEDDFVDSEDEWSENLRAAVGDGTYHDAKARHDLYFNDRVLQETNNYVNSLERYVETIVDCIANASVNVSSARELIGDADRKIRQWAAREDLEPVGGE